MGAALEVVTGAQTQATTTAGTYTAFTANSGQSFSIRQAQGTPAGTVLGPWASFGAAGKLQVKTPRWHDTTIGDTYHVQISTGTLAVQPLLDLWDGEPAYSTDTLTVQSTTDASQASSTNYAVAFPVYYPNLSGVDANFITCAQLQSYDNPLNKTGLHYVNFVTANSAATAGQIGTGVLINSTNDQYKAGHTYALIGYTVSAQCTSVLIQGTDTGNLYVGGPGSLDNKVTRTWFYQLAELQGLPLIPCIQANNKGTTNVFIQDGVTTSTAFIVSLIFWDLGVIQAAPGV
jgi:hypothetical protein